MGVPKFFRYISERYPCLSEVVKEYQLPEFDHLYLDMNGIIHVCSHPNDNDPHFRITEEKIFRDIFYYIETLFRMIQPQRLFFMAVDGVAPRAKMNQQRGRRFRSAKEAEVAEAKAKDRGEELPSAERFDSNCITPGTEFMTRLQAQLKYFVTFKISTDKLWQKVKVILSGHETPGEGEHKIMDYIRYMKSQPGYDPNTRHCLYGLDADLIMLGLCTHEPHFSLLREEVKYGKKNNQKRIPTPEETTFFLLHLSLMREYLDLEFQDLKKTLPFSYNLEHIIDDWVLMGFLVGNDFIPHLPDLHINKGALPILYKAYVEVLPTLGGYINEGGSLRLDRFQKYMEKLGAFDFEQFKEVSADLRFFESKTGRKPGGKERHSYKNTEDPPSPPKNKDLAALIAASEIDELEDDDDDDDDENYIDIDSDEEDEDNTCFAEFRAHKKNYYMEKLEYDKVTPEVLRSQGEGYVRAIQWNLNYYYNGCCSWSWFYPHHYAPFISDIKNFSGLKLEYDLAKPFLPFQQLLAVLPAASKKLLPPAYHELMVDDASPIIQFYPTEFKTDLNGKRQDWEAVVLIPFIEQESLLQAMDTKEHELTEEEKSRNKHGPMLVYTYTPEKMGSYVAPAYFPALANHHAKVELVHREELYVERSKLVKGLCPGVRLDVYFPGFPTLTHIPFTAGLEKAKVKVFESASQGENMILTILPQGHPNVSEVAAQLLGKSIYVNWPHLFEARVVGVASQEMRFKLNSEDGSITSEETNKTVQAQWNLTKQGIEERYKNRMGIKVGKTEILVYACTLEDKKFVLKDEKIYFEKQWSKYPIAYALQTTRTSIAVFEPTKESSMTLEQLFPVGATVFSMDPIHYGTKGTVLEGGKSLRVKVNFLLESKPYLDQMKFKLKRISPQYVPANQLAQRLQISTHLLSRITGTIYILSGDIQETEHKPLKLNIGLNLKFNKRNEEVCGYTRREKSGYWMYSSKAEEEVRQYMERFPEVFDYLKTHSPSEDVNANALYPKDTASKLSELGGWLKERGSMSAERQACGAQVLEEEVVLALEAFIDQFMKDELTTKTLTINSKPSNLYLPKPKLGQAPDSKAVHQLFDRIVNVRESHTVQLGAKGTIIGIHDADKGPEAMYDILFDKEFTGGLKLRCSPHRGYRLPGQAFINITFGQTGESNRAKGKPTAVVEPTGTEEEVSALNNNGHTSAFASWRNKPNQESGASPSQNRNEQKGRRLTPDQAFYSPHEQHGRNRHAQPNPNQYSGSHQLSNEYLAMFNQLQKTGYANKGAVGPKEPGVSNMDPSNALKKMLKITDDTSKKQPSAADNRDIMKHSKFSSYCSKLLSYHQIVGELPQYHYSDTPEGAIICTISYPNGPDFQGAPAYTNDVAAESAARFAVQYLEQRGWGPPNNAFHPSKRPPLLQTLPHMRPGFPAGPRILQYGRGEPAKPSTLPHPPMNWCSNSGAPSFQPEWRLGGAVRANNPPFFMSPQQYPHAQPTQHSPFNHYGHHNQRQTVDAAPRQQKPPFVPPQAEARTRQPSLSQPPKPEEKIREMPIPANLPPDQPDQKQGKGRKQPRMPPSGAINTGRSSAKPPKSRIAAKFAIPFGSKPPPDNSN